MLLIGGSGGLHRDAAAAAVLAAGREPAPVTAALVVTEVGNTVGSTLVALAAGAVLAWRGRRAEGACLAAVPIVASLVFTALKRLVDRARPPADLQVLAEANESLPSGHATMAAAAWTALVLVFWPSLTRRVRVLLTAFAVLWVGAVGFTRVYLGVHWLSDVLAGWALGAGLAFAGVTVLAARRHRATA
nr:phosphatase PAP2 family protein [Pseudonocardia sp. C8]